MLGVALKKPTRLPLNFGSGRLYVGSQRLHPIMAGSNVAEVFTCAFQHAIAIWIVVVVVVLSEIERAFHLTLRL